MAEDKPRYELHFHASGQAVVVSDYNKVSQLFEDSLTRLNSATVHQFPPNLAEFSSRQEELDAVLDLTVITEEEALELLTKLIGVERTQTELEAAKNIIELCGKLPLAIRITGGTLRNKPEWQLADYAFQLAAERQKLIQIRPSDLDVRASLSLSYQQLDASARLFRLLGLLSGPNFDPAIATALLESESKVAQECVARLVNMQLLEPAMEGRYRLHSLVRLFAKGQLAQEESSAARQDARLRVARWYLETSEIMDLALNSETRYQLAQVLNKKINQSLETTEQNLSLIALNWFEIERVNLLASIEWAYQIKTWEIVVSLAKNLVNFFNTNRYWTDWERTHFLAREASRELGDVNAEAQTLTNLGNVYSLLGEWGKARECYEKSLGIFEQLGNRLGVAKAIGNLANVYSQQGNLEKARECYQQSLNIFGELKDRYGEGQTLANMGILYAQQNQDEQAVVLWQEALKKLPPNLSKLKRVAEWLQSINRLNLETVPQLSETSAESKPINVLGGLFVVIVLFVVSFLLFVVN